MKSNKGFLLEASFFAVGNGALEGGAMMVLHCDFKETGKQAAPMGTGWLSKGEDAGKDSKKPKTEMDGSIHSLIHPPAGHRKL